ncbi:hypothetical protein A5784_14160 [Mycobacterium sp. 852013-50091_SCH5140682]|uniref:hypothetical protein n=1 Tax=Mycobacterium sp. 852013-50091_SCH5140682 TaxID=1834109 RepID=UPI0007E9AE7C|nr:hypothetical protein [Mycobacterium sp. 852013-50091_SCH5140682]OBC03372.1 hypothetical protein A5784_14160 [Mycobacterium sp. 852013-50091_SCH5140682]
MATVRAHVELNERELNDQVRAFEARRMRSLQRRVANQARADVPVDTGHLGQSIGEGQVRFTGPRTVAGSVHALAKYAAPVHEGRRARVIVPRRAQALRFQIGNRIVFAKRVVQGPMKGRPFLRNAGLRIASRER